MKVIEEIENLVFRHLWQAIGWLMVAVVMGLTLMPQPPQVSVVTWDKAQHFLAYAGLMFWFRQAFAPHARWVIFLILLGVIQEFIQGWSGHRHFEYADMLANTLGVGCGFLLASTRLGSLISRLDRILAGRLERWVRR